MKTYSLLIALTVALACTANPPDASKDAPPEVRRSALLEASKAALRPAIEDYLKRATPSGCVIADYYDPREKEFAKPLSEYYHSDADKKHAWLAAGGLFRISGDGILAKYKLTPLGKSVEQASRLMRPELFDELDAATAFCYATFRLREIIKFTIPAADSNGRIVSRVNFAVEIVNIEEWARHPGLHKLTPSRQAHATENYAAALLALHAEVHESGDSLIASTSVMQTSEGWMHEDTW